ncbi:class I SAM-dependent methyltransferase [Natronosporangium hydrolyticum]|uniref:Class I SAM-dependent methyltransferase n=1 Tax=Natronosporangium hydrolyticum TaxID=2811111 RepID=A0A895YC06_9ACTN|nr:class I SAM-dependent methyltransferase [Natronosporangium hydrolyticum]QSB15354.1 class I SAM-dependent methyltransferase [Natronosporangium hydrolyticum]
MRASEFYTGIVVDAYARLKSAHFDPEPYAEFVARAGQPALEIGCGDGEPLLTMRRRGLDVAGVDSSADMLGRCRANAAALGLEVTLHHQRMEELSLGRRYRSIYLAGPTFNLLPDDDSSLRALRAMRTHLVDGGSALVPLVIPEPTPTDQLGVAREAEGDDGAVLRYTAVSEEYDEVARTRTTRTRYERQTPVGLECAEREWILHWHTVVGFRALCAEAGLRVASVVDGSGAPANDTATSFTATVQRR